MSSRRVFIKLGTLFATSAFLEFPFQVSEGRSENESLTAFEPNAWLRVYKEGRYVFVLDKAEMGQGVMTALPILFAEEFDIEPNRLEIENAPADRRYKNEDLSMQVTGGSTSVHASWLPLRNAGASARAFFIDAAALLWRVKADECTTENGVVSHSKSQRSIAYHELFEEIPRVKAREGTLKKHSEFKYIGKINQRRENLLKVTGRAVFGIDAAPKNSLKAVVIRSPRLGDKPVSFDAKEALSKKGVVEVTKISTGVAVVAAGYWQAREAARVVKVTWENLELRAPQDSKKILEHYREIGFKDLSEVRSEGDFKASFATAEHKLEVVYDCPYVAHAPMEPQNCTVHLVNDSCEIWAPTQSPALAEQIASKVTKLPPEKINVHTTFLGGGFGRRLAQDFVSEACEIAVNLKEKVTVPIQILWSREDDMKHSMYRPNSLHILRGAVKQGKVQAWHHGIVTQSILSQVIPEWLPAMLPQWLPNKLKDWLGSGIGSAQGGLMKDATSVEGAKEVPYDIEHIEVMVAKVEPGVPVGFWRSVGHSFNAFVVESFIDELAHAAKSDPLQFRLNLLKKTPRVRSVLEKVSEFALWQKPPENKNLFRGVAVHESFRSVVATIAEVEVLDNQFKVTKLISCIDCGTVINPDMVKAQMESAAIFGLSTALYGEITFQDGSVEQSNFHDFQVLRLNECPTIEVHIMESEAHPTGVGEPGVPTIAPAVANAVFAATGKRLRSLPLKLG